MEASLGFSPGPEIMAETPMIIDIINGTNALYRNRDVVAQIDRWTTPVWYVLGIPGNVLAYTVWIQRRMRHSSGCYLAALALDECIFLGLQMVFELQFKWNIKLVEYPVLCELFPMLFLTSQYLSPLLVLGFTVERYISVCHPFQREIYCTTRRAVKVILSLVTLTLMVNSVQGYFWQYDFEQAQCKLRDEESETKSRNYVERPQLHVKMIFSVFVFQVTQHRSLSLWSIWTWITEMLVFGAVPLCILFLNVLVILETRRLAGIEKRLTHQQLRLTDCAHKRSGTVHKGAGGPTAPSATTVMLLAVSFFLIATTLPVTLLYVLYLSFAEGDEKLNAEERLTDLQWQRHYAYANVRIVVEELGMSHYALNFYIYLFTGKIFRRELCRVLRRVLNACNSGSNRRYSGWFDKDDTSFVMVTTTKSEHKREGSINGTVAQL